MLEQENRAEIETDRKKVRGRKILTKSYKTKLASVGLDWVDAMGLINSNTTEVSSVIIIIIIIMNGLFNTKMLVLCYLSKLLAHK